MCVPLHHHGDGGQDLFWWETMETRPGLFAWPSLAINVESDRKALTHRIHGAGIYANIGGILMVNVT